MNLNISAQQTKLIITSNESYNPDYVQINDAKYIKEPKEDIKEYKPLTFEVLQKSQGAITKIKRLSDNQIFEVNERVINIWGNKVQIDEIYYPNLFKPEFIAVKDRNNQSWPLNDINKLTRFIILQTIQNNKITDFKEEDYKITKLEDEEITKVLDTKYKQIIEVGNIFFSYPNTKSYSSIWKLNLVDDVLFLNISTKYNRIMHFIGPKKWYEGYSIWEFKYDSIRDEVSIKSLYLNKLTAYIKLFDLIILNKSKELYELFGESQIEFIVKFIQGDNKIKILTNTNKTLDIGDIKNIRFKITEDRINGNIIRNIISF